MKKINYTIYSLKAIACLFVIFLHVSFPGGGRQSCKAFG